MDEKKYKQVPGVVSHTFGEETYILDQIKDDVITLNETGKIIWESLRKPLTQKQIVTKLSRVYEASGNVIEKDVVSLVKLLLKRSLVKNVS